MLEVSKVSLNVILHVTILFTILSFLFMLYISKITTTAINKELNHIIHDSLKKLLYTKDGHPVKPSIKIMNINDTTINNISSIISNPIQDAINQKIIDDPIIKVLVDNNNSLKNQLSNIANTTVKESIKSSINTNNSEIIIQMTNIITKFDYDYYINLYSHSDSFSTTVNNNLFTSIKIINATLVLFLIFFIYYILQTNSITIMAVLGIFMENIITFIFVGAVEFWFFQNVASKFIPVEPSIITKTLFSSLKDYLSTRIMPEKT